MRPNKYGALFTKLVSGSIDWRRLGHYRVRPKRHRRNRVRLTLFHVLCVLTFSFASRRPPTKCFPSPEARTTFLANTVLQRSYDVSPNVTDEANRNHLIELQRDANTLYKTQFAICAQTMGDLLKYAGTSTVVRDIDLLTTLIDGKDALMCVRPQVTCFL